MQQVKPKKKRTTKKRAVKPSNLTIKRLVEGVGVSDTTLKKYFARGCPRTSVEAVQKWRSENIKAVAEDADVSEIGIELKRAEMAERWENARTRQMKNDLMNGRLIRKDEYELSLRTGISRLMNRLQSLGTKCANICPAELKVPVKEAVEDTVRIALKELCDDLRTVT
jgi:hypothetical protein